MMKRIVTAFVVAMIAFIAVPSVALAAKPQAAPTVEQVGYDISYPQCGKKLPTSFYFGIVGVNGGTASTPNKCLADQLAWAKQAKGGTNQAKVQLYVNTANPGEIISQVTTWPTSPLDANGSLPQNPYGNTCSGQNDKACSWLYGWNRSIYTENVFKTAAANKGMDTNTADYVWWLDVETMNTWETNGSDALARNTAALEGFGAYYQSNGAGVGLYSTAVQWSAITGNTNGAGGNLNNLPNWRPSGSSLSNAKSNCSVAPLTPGGYISLTQYISGGLDNNHSCI